MKMLRWSVAALLVLAVAGCAAPAPQSQSHDTQGAVTQADAPAARELVRSYERAIASGAAGEAASMFLEPTSEAVREWVAKAVAYADYDPASVEIKELAFYRLEDGGLAPADGGERLYPSELERLAQLTRDNPTPGLITFRVPSGDLMRFFVVRTASGLKLTR